MADYGISGTLNRESTRQRLGKFDAIPVLAALLLSQRVDENMSRRVKTAHIKTSLSSFAHIASSVRRRHPMFVDVPASAPTSFNDRLSYWLNRGLVQRLYDRL